MHEPTLRQWLHYPNLHKISENHLLKKISNEIVFYLSINILQVFWKVKFCLTILLQGNLCRFLQYIQAFNMIIHVNQFVSSVSHVCTGISIFCSLVHKYWIDGKHIPIILFKVFWQRYERAYVTIAVRFPINIVNIS